MQSVLTLCGSYNPSSATRRVSDAVCAALMRDSDSGSSYDPDELMADARIIRDPAIMTGKPCVAGTRITVEYILELLEGGHSIDEIASEHRGLTRQDVEAAIAFAREAVRGSSAPAAK